MRRDRWVEHDLQMPSPVILIDMMFEKSAFHPDHSIPHVKYHLHLDLELLHPKDCGHVRDSLEVSEGQIHRLRQRLADHGFVRSECVSIDKTNNIQMMPGVMRITADDEIEKVWQLTTSTNSDSH